MNGLEVVEEESSDSEEIKENLEQLHLKEQTSPIKEEKEPVVVDDGKLHMQYNFTINRYKGWEVVKRNRRKSNNS